MVIWQHLSDASVATLVVLGAYHVLQVLRKSYEGFVARKKH